MLIPVSPAGPPAQSQFQPPIATSKLDCVPCSAAKAIRRATLDAKAPSTKAVRAEVGVFTRGLTYGEMVEAAEHWGVELEAVYLVDRDEMQDQISGGRGALLSIRCTATVHTERATGTFRGDHTVYVHDFRHVEKGGDCRCEKHSAKKAHNEYLIEDPGNSSKGYQWWSAKLVYEAAEARNPDPKTGETKGINLCLTPDTEGVHWRAVMKGGIRAEPSTNAPRLRSIDVTKVYRGGRTETGGPWKRADGSTGHTWVHVEYSPGKWGWINGRRLVHA